MPTGTIAGNVYDKAGTRNPVARLLLRRFHRRMAELLAPLQPSRILEVGCGEGDVSRRMRDLFPRARVTGCDLSAAILREARGRAPGARFAAASAYRLPFADGSFDLVLLCEALEHMDDPACALREAARVSACAVLVTVPWEPLWRALNLARGAYVRDLGNTPGHVQHFGRAAIARLVAAHLQVDQVQGSLPWTLVRARVAGVPA